MAVCVLCDYGIMMRSYISYLPNICMVEERNSRTESVSRNSKSSKKLSNRTGTRFQIWYKYGCRACGNRTKIVRFYRSGACEKDSVTDHLQDLSMETEHE